MPGSCRAIPITSSYCSFSTRQRGQPWWWYSADSRTSQGDTQEVQICLPAWESKETIQGTSLAVKLTQPIPSPDESKVGLARRDTATPFVGGTLRSGGRSTPTG